MISSVSSFQSFRWLALLSLLLCTLLVADVSYAAEANSNSSQSKTKTSKKQTKKSAKKKETQKTSKKKVVKKAAKKAKKASKKSAKTTKAKKKVVKKKATKKATKKAAKKASKKVAKKVAKKKAKKKSKPKKKQPSKDLLAFRSLLKKFEKVYAMQITAKTLDGQKKQWSSKKKLYDQFASELKKLTNSKDKSVAVCAYRAMADASVELAEAASEAPLPKRKKKWNKKDAKDFRAGIEKSLSHFRRQGYTYYKAGLALAKKHKVNNNCSQSLAQIVKYVEKRTKKSSKKKK